MFDSKKTNDLRKLLFKGNEQERMISAGVLRTIFADITRLYFENKQARGKGILIFNGDDPEKSKYITKEELQDDLALAQEDCLDDFAEGFKKMINVIDKESDNDLALVAMVYPDGIAVNIINPDEINEKIDELSNGLIF
jgi:hypothetical protein